MTLITSLTAVNYQHNTTSLWKKPLEAADRYSKSGNLDCLLGEIKGWLLQDVPGGGATTTLTSFMFVTGAVMANPVLVGAVTEKSIEKEISTWMRNWRDRAGGKKLKVLPETFKIVCQFVFALIK